jgi:hypothetical protein
MKSRFSSAFEAAMCVGRDTGNNAVGQICLANEARFNSSFLSTPLTGYTVGWTSGQGLEDLLELLAPAVPTARRFSYKKAVNAEAFLGEADDSDIRAIGAEFKVVTYTGTTAEAKTYNKGLTVRLDLDEEDDDPMLEERCTSNLMKRLLRMEIRRAVALHDAAAVNAAKTWGAASPVDADMDMLAAIIAGADDTGVRANRVGMGMNAWSKRLLTLRAGDKAGAIANSAMTPEQLAGFLAVDKVFLCNELVQTGKATKANLLGSNAVYMYNAVSGAGKDDPSNIKRFVSNMGGGAFRVYRHEVTAKLVDISVEHYSNIVATSTLGVRKLTIS